MLRVFKSVLLLLTLSISLSAAPPATPKPQPSTDPWWKHAVVYEIYPRSFQDSNGDGIGDLNGITSRLDYLHDLGIDAIWVTPFYPSPQIDFGYDIADYTAVDPQFGTMADFDRLVSEAKKRNIRVIVDYVANHTSDQNLWFKESRSSRDNPKRDWYIWREERACTAAEQLALMVWAFRVDAGFIHRSVLLPLLLRSTAGLELAQCGSAEGYVRCDALLAESRRCRISY